MENCVEWYNFFATTLLSILLIIITVIVSIRQNKLQKQINDDQNQLQKLIAEKDVKVAMYQHRMNCYLQVMQALDIVNYSKLEDTIDIFKTEDISRALKKISDGRDLLFRAYVESEALFDKEVVSLIDNIYRHYNELYCITCNMITISNEEFEKRRVLLSNKIGIKPSDSKDEMFLKNETFKKSANYLDDYVEIYPEQKEYYLILEVLKQYYEPDNKLYQLVKKYLQIENL
jgi:hypothetical protein